jgi:hypothetical protein
LRIASISTVRVTTLVLSAGIPHRRKQLLHRLVLVMLSGKDQASVALGVLHVEVKAGLDELCEHGLIALACRFEILIAQALLDRQFVLSVSRYGQQAQHGREHQSVHDSLIEKNDQTVEASPRHRGAWYRQGRLLPG